VDRSKGERWAGCQANRDIAANREIASDAVRSWTWASTQPDKLHKHLWSIKDAYLGIFDGSHGHRLATARKQRAAAAPTLSRNGLKLTAVPSAVLHLRLINTRSGSALASAFLVVCPQEPVLLAAVGAGVNILVVKAGLTSQALDQSVPPQECPWGDEKKGTSQSVSSGTRAPVERKAGAFNVPRAGGAALLAGAAALVVPGLAGIVAAVAGLVAINIPPTLALAATPGLKGTPRVIVLRLVPLVLAAAASGAIVAAGGLAAAGGWLLYRGSRTE
jgi:hypothetical protein